ncbi:MAG: 4Fe-4S binding protein [Armatimonadetes bacterium]|nr:4Fe-4S binding protein [Armatimonadota bacterium]
MGAPVFYCDSCPWSVMACPLGMFMRYSKMRLFPFITVAMLAIVGAFGGRIICGWVCPFGLLQDLLYKIRTRKLAIPPQARYLKYVILVVFLVGVPYFFPTSKFSFCDGCPSGTLENMLPKAFIGHFSVSSGLFNGFTPRFYTRVSILLATLLLSVFVSRGFCRTLCPLGAIFGLFNKFSIFRYNQTFQKCNSCGGCKKVCPVDIDPVKEINGAECIRCYECTTTKHIKMGVK